MDLFNNTRDITSNILPYGGMAHYLGPIIPTTRANEYLERLMTQISWQQDQVNLYGKTILTKRKVAWYGDLPYKYTYSKTTKTALKWTKDLLILKQIVEEESSTNYNSCLLNLYHDGSEGMSWHSDNEKELQEQGMIASLNFGAERTFIFKHKTTKKKIYIELEHGSLLLMYGDTQTNWLHSLPPRKRIGSPRVNLTFRTIKNTS